MSAMERDLADLRCFAALLEAHRQWESETGQRANIKALREWLWFYWQAPRRPQPLVRNKYPALIPWSMAARQVISGSIPGGLVIEHREPIKLVIRELLDQSPVDLGQLREVLDTRLTCCVITKEEDRAVTKAGYGTAKVPGAGDDPWARYRAAGIDPDTFAPLTP